MMNKQKGFIQIPLLIAIIVASISVVSAGTSIVLYEQGKLAPLVANISEVFKITEELANGEEENLKSEESQMEKSQESEIARLETEKGIEVGKPDTKVNENIAQSQSLETDNNSTSNLQSQIDALLEKIAILEQQPQTPQEDQTNIDGTSSEESVSSPLVATSTEQYFIYSTSSTDNNIKTTEMAGTENQEIGIFILENKDNEDINLSNIKMSIAYDFGKNLLSPVQVYIQYPINLFGVSKKDTFVAISDEICSTKYSHYGNVRNNICNEETLAKLENVSLELPDGVILEKGKKIRLSIIANIIIDATVGEYKQVMVFKSCEGYGVETQRKFECDQQNIPGKDLNIAGLPKL